MATGSRVMIFPDSVSMLVWLGIKEWGHGKNSTLPQDKFSYEWDVSFKVFEFLYMADVVFSYDKNTFIIYTEGDYYTFSWRPEGSLQVLYEGDLSLAGHHQALPLIFDAIDWSALNEG